MLLYVAAAGVFLLSLLLAFLVGLIPSLQGSALLIARILLVLIGVAGAIVLVVLGRKRQHTLTGGKAEDTSALDELLREANRKLAASPRAGAKSLNALPLFYILGPENSAKTTSILKSGMEPELLAGQLYRDKEIVSTPVANIWYTAKGVIVEAGEAVRNSPALWNRLVSQTRPKAHRAAFAGAPFRAAVVCASADQFITAQSTEGMQAAAAGLGERLRQLAQQLGTQIPVYVLLTKLDRVPGFTDFVRNLSGDESTSLLGVATPAADAKAGLYVEQATSSIASAYDQLLFDLSQARIEVLYREADTARASAAFEFPRELRRFRNHLTTWLVELTRPSHLSNNPYLRGFYLTGVRAVLQQGTVAAPAQAPLVRPAAADATSIFSAPVAAQPRQAPQSSAVSEKIAQWTFLPRFFPEIVFGDTRALANTAQTQYGSLFRRLLYGTIAALLLIYLAGLTTSYFNNAALEHQIASTSAALASSPAPSTALASPEQLTLLDQLRADLVQLESFRDNGAPLSYRWGLYRGNLLLDPARRTYFAHFRNLLLNRTQTNIIDSLNSLPATPAATPAPGTDYNSIYAALRAYLITTSNPEKSTEEFLPPVLLNHWQNGTAPSTADQQGLAERQFAFYAAELPRANPFSITPAGQAVTHARGYLASFGGFERIYQSMLTAAAKAGPAINFNADHLHSAEFVTEPHVIPAAFTKPGYAFMQDALAHPDRYFKGEAWVLGDQAPPSLDLSKLKDQLAARYQADFLGQWRAFLKDASVVRYRTLADAGSRLTVISGNNSPLLALVYTASANTAVPNPEIATAFQAPQTLVPPASAEQYIGPGNKSYVDALLALNGAIKQVATNPNGANDPAAAMPVSTAASAAHLAAQQAAQGFHIDSQAHIDATVLALMEAPITSADSLVHGLGPAQANAGGKSFCAAYNSLFAKAPFNPKATVQATPAEVSALLAPNTGALWQFYNASLKALIVQQGNDYAVAPNPPMQVNPAFVHFFSRAANLSQELFPPGATAPSLTFVLRNLPSPGIQSSTFKVDAQSLASTETQKQFTWSAQTASQASLTANSIPITMNGPWSLFELLDKAHVQRGTGNYELSFPLELANTPSALVVRYELSGPGADVLAPGALSNLRCVSAIAH